MRHIWNIIANPGSLWVAWVKENLLKGRNFWQAKIPQELFLELGENIAFV
jgi:hypothetical protein